MAEVGRLEAGSRALLQGALLQLAVWGLQDCAGLQPEDCIAKREGDRFNFSCTFQPKGQSGQSFCL